MKNKSVKLFAIIVFIFTVLFSFSGCKACARTQWKQVYDAYTNKTERFVFQTFNATITQKTFAEIKTEFKILIDSDDFFEKYKDYPNAQAAVTAYQRQRFYFVDESIVILEESGFFDDINEDTVITFTTNDYIGWDGWRYPVFAVDINGKTYLDFETGYTNVINFVKEKINNP